MSLLKILKGWVILVCRTLPVTLLVMDCSLAQPSSLRRVRSLLLLYAQV